MTAPERGGPSTESVFAGGVPESVDRDTLDGRLVAEITRILFAADPIGIVSGADATRPDAANEYRPEAETISVRLSAATSAADVAAIVHTEFRRWFTPSIAGAAERYQDVGTQIWALVNGTQERTS